MFYKTDSNDNNLLSEKTNRVKPYKSNAEIWHSGLSHIVVAAKLSRSPGKLAIVRHRHTEVAIATAMTISTDTTESCLVTWCLQWILPWNPWAFAMEEKVEKLLHAVEFPANLAKVGWENSTRNKNDGDGANIHSLLVDSCVFLMTEVNANSLTNLTNLKEMH